MLACPSTHIYIHIYIYVQAQRHICVHVYDTCICRYERIYMCIYVQTYIYTHAYMYRCMPKCLYMGILQPFHNVLLEARVFFAGRGQNISERQVMELCSSLHQVQTGLRRHIATTLRSNLQCPTAPKQGFRRRFLPGQLQGLNCPSE